MTSVYEKRIPVCKSSVYVVTTAQNKIKGLLSNPVNFIYLPFLQFSGTIDLTWLITDDSQQGSNAGPSDNDRRWNIHAIL